MVEAVSCSAPTRKVLQRAANNRDSAEKVVARSKVCFQGKAEVGPEANFANSVENDRKATFGTMVLDASIRSQQHRTE
jgi:hypothetical protein